MRCDSCSNMIISHRYFATTSSINKQMTLQESLQADVSSAVAPSNNRFCECVQIAVDVCPAGSLVHATCDPNNVAVANDNLLSIMMAKSSCRATDQEDVVDVEFDESIEAVCWGPSATCIIVGDSKGKLHFLTPTGDVIFSHGLLSKSGYD
jgi:hypothetical protein